MKIKKIKTISSYKSFTNFSWDNFCKDCSNSEQSFLDFSLIFGENGSGKSSICEILKSLSQNQDFQSCSPDKVEIEIKNGSNQIYKFENGSWLPNQINKNNFLFFDVDFISGNVHTHGDRSNQQGKHSQNSGKMIIDLDDRANQLKALVQDRKEESENFIKINSAILDKTFSSDEIDLFNFYKDKNREEIEGELIRIQNDKSNLETDLASLQKIYQKYSQIGQIVTINYISESFLISNKDVYSEIFSREIKEKSQYQTDGKIKQHFERHKRLIERIKDEIPQDYKNDNCPLCMQPLSAATEFIEYYRSVFDQTYEIEKKRFLSDITILQSELQDLKNQFKNLPIKLLQIFDYLEKLKIDYGIAVYEIDEKIKYTKFDKLFSGLEELFSGLENLKNIASNNFIFLNDYLSLL